eukprot:jgi/Botrbrau1/54/Bobra.0022s0048.1
MTQPSQPIPHTNQIPDDCYASQTKTLDQSGVSAVLIPTCTSVGNLLNPHCSEFVKFAAAILFLIR